MNVNEKQFLIDRVNPNELKLISFLEEFNYTINSAGYYDLDSSWLCKGRYVDDSMFFMFFSGGASVTIKEETAYCTRGMISFMPEGFQQKWSVDASKNSEIIKMVVIHLDPVNAWKLNLFKLFKSNFVTMQNLDYWQNRFIHFVGLFNTDKKLGQSVGASLVKELLIDLIINGFAVMEPDKNLDPRLLSVLNCIHENFQRDIGVEELAELAHLSSVQLRKIFSRDLGCNPKEYISEYRFKKATEWLKYTSLTIKEIAFKAGFNNDHYFHLSFKDKFNLTPSEFRANGSKQFGM